MDAHLNMKHQYPWLKEYPFGLPLSWMFRIITYLKKRNQIDNTKNPTKDKPTEISIGIERVKLLKKYGIIH